MSTLGTQERSDLGAFHRSTLGARGRAPIGCQHCGPQNQVTSVHVRMSGVIPCLFCGLWDTFAPTYRNASLYLPGPSVDMEATLTPVATSPTNPRRGCAYSGQPSFNPDVLNEIFYQFAGAEVCDISAGIEEADWNLGATYELYEDGGGNLRGVLMYPLWRTSILGTPTVVNQVWFYHDEPLTNCTDAFVGSNDITACNYNPGTMNNPIPDTPLVTVGPWELYRFTGTSGTCTVTPS